jgi:hypothetical protein
MDELYFGRIEGLAICGGQPVFDPPPRAIRQVKLGGANGPRAETDHSDFALKTQIVELFEFFSQLGDGTIETLEIQYSLPFRLIVTHLA